MAEALSLSVTPEQIAEALQAAGFRAEHYEDSAGRQNIMSGTNGVPFRVRMGNRAAPPVEGYLDFSFIMLIKIQGQFPLERVNEWNKQRRFSRLHHSEEFIVLDMDAIVAGGVGEGYVRGLVELWDRIIQEMMQFLREGAPAEGAVSAA